MNIFTKSELELLERAIEMKIVVYECYDSHPKFKIYLREYIDLLRKVKLQQNLMEFKL